MHDLKWTDAEKKVARRAFEAALQAELAQTISNFKSRAAAVTVPEEHAARAVREQDAQVARPGL